MRPRFHPVVKSKTTTHRHEDRRKDFAGWEAVCPRYWWQKISGAPRAWRKLFEISATWRSRMVHSEDGPIEHGAGSLHTKHEGWFACKIETMTAVFQFVEQ